MKINEQVRRMNPPRYTRPEAAAMVGRDVDTLRRWKRQGTFVPKESKQFGKTTVDLYSDDDIESMRQLARSIKPGRKAS